GDLPLLVFNAPGAGCSWHVWLLGRRTCDSRRKTWQDRHLSRGRASAKATTRWRLRSLAATLDQSPGIWDPTDSLFPRPEYVAEAGYLRKLGYLSGHPNG